MNRRKFLGFAAALLPCSLVAKLPPIGRSGPPPKHRPDPPPNPKFDFATYEDIAAKYPPFIPTSGFHIEIRELPERMIGPTEYTDWKEKTLLPCFRATIRDCSGKQSVCALQSPVWEDNEHKTKYRRRALDFLYRDIGGVIRRRQFPKDTLIYDQEITVNGVQLMNPRYPK